MVAIDCHWTVMAPALTVRAMKPRTLFEKLWDNHLVRPQTADTPAVLYVDLHLIHEVTSPQAFTWLRERGLRVRQPARTVATMDHSIPTRLATNGKAPLPDHIPEGVSPAFAAAFVDLCHTLMNSNEFLYMN